MYITQIFVCMVLVSVYEKLTVAFGKTRHKLLLSQRSSGKKERCGSLSPGRFRGLEAPNITAGYSHCIDAIATFSSFKVSKKEDIRT